MAANLIKEWTASPQSLRASFGTNSYGGETYDIVQGDNGCCVSDSLDDPK